MHSLTYISHSIQIQVSINDTHSNAYVMGIIFKS